MGYIISYYNNENPAASSSGAGADWIHPAGAGDGSTSGIESGWVTPPEPPSAETPKSTPWLKRSCSGRMLLHGGWLLGSGGLCPELLPAAKLYLSGARSHAHCLLLKIEGAGSYFHQYITSGDLTAPALLLYRFPEIPAEFTIYGGWQSGHYDHALVNSARIEAYGISSGFMTLPLGAWRKMAFVRIDAERNVFVNNLKGNYNADN